MKCQLSSLISLEQGTTRTFGKKNRNKKKPKYYEKIFIKINFRQKIIVKSSENSVSFVLVNIITT